MRQISPTHLRRLFGKPLLDLRIHLHVALAVEDGLDVVAQEFVHLLRAAADVAAGGELGADLLRAHAEFRPGGQLGNQIQDVAAIRTLEELTEEYLHKFGYYDINVTTVFHQWMGGFPADEAKAFGVIAWGAACATLAKATKVIVKTPHEAAGVPTKEANAAGLRCTKQLTNMLLDQVTVGSRMEHEKEIIKAETRCIMDKVIALGHGDIILGAIAAINAGVIDIPFGPAKCNAGIMLPARDNGGAVRILEVGNLPFTDDLKKFHREKLEERAKAENREVSFQMVIDDVYAISKGRLVGRPRY